MVTRVASCRIALIQDVFERRWPMFTTAMKTRITLKNVLFATDFSPISEAAFQYAAAIARRFGSKLHAVHVVPPDAYKYVPGGAGELPWDLDEMQTKQEMKHLEDRMGVIPHDATSTTNADMLVVGTHGRTGLGRVLLGSIAESVFRQSACPVLTVGPKVASDAPRDLEFNRVLFATDFSDESLAAAPYALGIAHEFQARLTLLNAVHLPLEPLESAQVLRSEAEKQLRKLLPADNDLWCTPDFIVTFGDAAQNILKVAKEQQADLIVIGVRGAGGAIRVATHVADAIAHEVVSHAKCPVLTIRG